LGFGWVPMYTFCVLRGVLRFFDNTILLTYQKKVGYDATQVKVVLSFMLMFCSVFLVKRQKTTLKEAISVGTRTTL
jgi:hypothetical protein